MLNNSREYYSSEQSVKLFLCYELRLKLYFAMMPYAISFDILIHKRDE